MSEGTPLSPWTVVVSRARQEVARSALRTGLSISIGRAPDCTIMLTAMTVARYQGRIELVNGVPTYFADAPGSMVDGDPVEGSTQLGERTLLEVGGFQIALVRTRTATAAPKPAAPGPAAPAGDASVETLLDRHIQGVRAHRSVNQQDDQAKSNKFEEAWRKVVNDLRVIKSRYGSHPNVIDFTISKDEREVIVKLRESSPRGYAYFCLSRFHPEGKFPALQAIWLREVGRQDESHTEPQRGLEDLISRLAPRLA